MSDFGSAKWIWTSDSAAPDEYGEFYSEFEYSSGDAELLISADSNYAVYLNGTLLASMQYADFPYDKVYDRIDLSGKVISGKNRLAIVVWYLGDEHSSVYYKGDARLIFALNVNGAELISSGEKTLSRMSRAYENHREKKITYQLSFSFSYDIARDDGWMLGADLSGFSESFVLKSSLPLRPRPCERLVRLPERVAKLIRRISETELLFDLGINSVGLIKIEAVTSSSQSITVAYGEHIADGRVRRLVGGRDFSVEIGLRAGKNEYMNPFRRLGCRYLEVISEKPLSDICISIVETVYPLRRMARPKLSPSESEIYGICERTLLLCMHEHYEDCPWREQALYCMDSRNQMLAGYYAFGEYRFPRANLELISKDRRRDGLLSICYPMNSDRVIPSFSLHYFREVYEYMLHSGDTAFVAEIYPKLSSILSAFIERMDPESSLVPPFTESDSYWNFYEWENGLSGRTEIESFIDGINEYNLENRSVPDLILNSLLLIAIDIMMKISERLGYSNPYSELSESLRKSIRAEFFSESRGIFLDRKGGEAASILGNSLAILAGAATLAEASRIVSEIFGASCEMTEISLSMICFLYDAAIMVDREKYAPAILADIEKKYRPMVEAGIGTVWETERGESDFSDAGSLCHGWSAMPIYYFHILKGEADGKI